LTASPGGRNTWPQIFCVDAKPLPIQGLAAGHSPARTVHLQAVILLQKADCLCEQGLDSQHVCDFVQLYHIRRVNLKHAFVIKRNRSAPAFATFGIDVRLCFASLKESQFILLTL
jgi:hypothetical protein